MRVNDFAKKYAIENYKSILKNGHIVITGPSVAETFNKLQFKNKQEHRQLLDNVFFVDGTISCVRPLFISTVLSYVGIISNSKIEATKNKISSTNVNQYNLFSPVKDEFVSRQAKGSQPSSCDTSGMDLGVEASFSMEF